MTTNKPISTKKKPENRGLCDITSANFKRLIKQNKTSQKDLADKLNISAATMTDYCSGKHLPNAEVLVSLKKLYGISIDDFLTKNFDPSILTQSISTASIDSNMLMTYQKYCGFYFVYYFDTSKYKGRDSQPPKDSLVFGILLIYEDPSSLDVPIFKCAAVLGINDRVAVSHVKATLESMKDFSKIKSFISTKYPATAYYGDFELSSEHAFVSMQHANTDKALLILHRVDSNKEEYTGGIGTINSVSKGRERAPVIQFMGISRHPLSMSAEEIHHSLLLNYPNFKAESETEEMIQNFKNLFGNSEDGKKGFSDYQKSIMVRSTLERHIRKSLERNMFRYGKVSERDDDEWYHAIKVASISDTN